MASLLSNLYDNLAEGVHEIKCKNGHDKKNLKNVEKIQSIVLTLMMISYVCGWWNQCI